MSEQEYFEEWENIQPREYFWNDLNKEIAFSAWQACAERKDAEIAGLREAIGFIVDDQKTRIVPDKVVWHILIQNRLIDESGNPKPLLTGNHDN